MVATHVTSIGGSLPKAADIKQAQLRVLLVEDHPPNVMVAQAYLEDFGYIVEVVTNGQDAIEAAEKGAYVAILMDVQMQGMDGFEATATIRDYEKRTGRPPHMIIGMTAHALIGDRERCINSGMDDYITKPFNAQELQHRLALLSQQKLAE